MLFPIVGLIVGVALVWVGISGRGPDVLKVLVKDLAG